MSFLIVHIIYQVVCALLWVFFASYYFWGANEVTVTAPIDESGWVPDGAFASTIPVQAEQVEES